jgi:hypothetical protein
VSQEVPNRSVELRRVEAQILPVIDPEGVEIVILEILALLHFTLAILASDVAGHEQYHWCEHIDHEFSQHMRNPPAGAGLRFLLTL